MSGTSSKSFVSIGPMFALFLVFLTLKLTGYIAWSWWWVAAPLWISFSIVLLFLLSIGVAVAIIHFYRGE